MTKTRRQNYTLMICDHCGEVYRAARSHSRFCSAACRKAAWRVDTLHNASPKQENNTLPPTVGEGDSAIKSINPDDVVKLIRALKDGITWLK